MKMIKDLMEIRKCYVKNNKLLHLSVFQNLLYNIKQTPYQQI